MRSLGIDYGDSRVGIAISDELNITAQGLETIHHKGNDKTVLKRLEELTKSYQISTFVIGMPINMDGTEGERVKVTKMFIHKLKCKFNNIKIETVDERLTTVQAHKTMNFLNVNNREKRNIVDTISAVYILEIYMNKSSKL
ncbi:MAG: Holliday junction resolvase RuvX [Clostridia bacterium]|nr:Holliday junction resolvase RuvX [Clostridia bacterium]